MKFTELILKNKKYLIILVLGIILLLLGNVSGGTEKKNTTSYAPVFIDEKKLTDTLEEIEGAGRVKVFISYRDDGEKQIAQKVSRTDNGTETTPENVDDGFYVVSVKTPEITGVLITASGASDLNVRERIMRGAKHALGIPYHKISVEWGK